MIDVQNLNVTFGRGKNELHAVRDVSFHIAQGESFGLVGESGSGKSTVLRAISRLIRDWTGTIKLNGTKLGYRRDKATARRMQMVFQEPLMARCIRAIPSTIFLWSPSKFTT